MCSLVQPDDRVSVTALRILCTVSHDELKAIEENDLNFDERRQKEEGQKRGEEEQHSVSLKHYERRGAVSMSH